MSDQAMKATNFASVEYAEAATDESPRWVAEEHARLSERLTQLDKTIEVLTVRLAPVLAPDSPHAMLGEKIDKQSRSPFADELAQNAEHIEAAIERLLRIERRLEI